MFLKDLLSDAVGSEYEDLIINKVTSKLDEIDNQSVFVFLRGIFRNNDFLIYEAQKKSPALIISEQELSLSVPHFRVKNARKTLSEMLYKLYFPHIKPPPIVAITGTNGKSSTLQILYHIFKDKYKIGLLGTQRIEIDGIPLQSAEYTMTTPDPEVLYPTLYEMSVAKCDYIFMEVSSHALALEKVAPLTFEIALFTGLSEEHLDFHKTKEEYIKAKEKIFSQSILSILNTDDKTGQEYAKRISSRFLSLGRNGKDIQILNSISNFMRGIVFTYVMGNEKHFVKCPLLALHNIYNCALALSVYAKLDGDISRGVSRLACMPQIKGRMECVYHAPSVFLDYAHTPLAMENVLNYFYHSKSTDQNIIVVFGAGGDRDREKRAKLASVAEKYASFCIVTTDNPRNESQFQIFKDIHQGFQSRKYRFVSNREKAISYAFSMCKRNDILVLLGKGHEPYIIKKGQKIPYSELYSLHLAKIQGGRNEN